MRKLPIKPNQIQYDESHDVLHVFFYPLEFSTDDEDFPGVVIRRSIEAERVTGITIMDFSKRSNEFIQTALPRYDFTEVWHQIH